MPSDTAAFINAIHAHTWTPAGFFRQGEPIWVARAPGRIDLMGGIADYSGATVLELPIAEATFAAVQLRLDQRVEILSVGADRPGGHSTFSGQLAPILGTDQADRYAASRQQFNDIGQRWASVRRPMQLWSW